MLEFPRRSIVNISSGALLKQECRIVLRAEMQESSTTVNEMSSWLEDYGGRIMGLELDLDALENTDLHSLIKRRNVRFTEDWTPSWLAWNPSFVMQTIASSNFPGSSVDPAGNRPLKLRWTRSSLKSTGRHRPKAPRPATATLRQRER